MLDLNLIVGDYLVNHINKGQEILIPFSPKVWRDEMIHLSDVGKCPRQIMLRLQGAKKREEPLAIALREARFYMGHQTHYLVYSALMYFEEKYKEEIYEGCEVSLYDHLHSMFGSGVTGALDLIIKGPIFFEDADALNFVLDIKSMHPNLLRNMRDNLPLEQHKTQVVLYDFFYREWKNVKMGLPAIVYLDNGGGDNPHEICFIKKQEYESLLDTAMSDLGNLLGARALMESEGYDNIPEMLPRRIYIKGKRNPEVRVGPAWSCNPKYCDYLGASCFPDTNDELVAKEYKSGISYGDGHREAERMMDDLAGFIANSFTSA